MNNIATRPVAGSNHETEFDFIHPKTGKRIRRKIKANAYIASKSKAVLEELLREENRDMTIDELKSRVQEDVLTSEHTNDIIRICEILYFNYLPNTEYTDREIEATRVLDAIFTDKPDINITFLGKAGSGKSSIIHKMSCFADKGEDINFPFVDTSRTTAFVSEYLFVPPADSYRCAVVYLANDVVEMKVDECIERAVYKAIELRLQSDDGDGDRLGADSTRDRVINAFYSDPSLLFDIRLCLGRHIKKNSKNYPLPENKNATRRWETIAAKAFEIAETIVGKIPSRDVSPYFYQERFTQIVKGGDGAPAYPAYESLRSFVMSEISNTKKRVYSDITKNGAVTQIAPQDGFFQCHLTYHSAADFRAFISAFTSKSVQVFGNSLFPLVYKLKIEIPYHDMISADIRSKRICCTDTVGISHSIDNNGGLERGASLSLDKTDAIVIVDDSRLNMDANTGAILKHIAYRVDSVKIYFALTFFDDFKNESFDESEDLDKQKTDYLSSIQREKVSAFLEDNDDSRMIIQRLRSGKNTFYLKGLARDAQADMGALRRMLESIRQDTEMTRNYSEIRKKDARRPMVSYDYRKLPLYYTKAQTAFISGQRSIYMEDSPYFKATEALTRRLSVKEDFFIGKSRILKPADDLYAALANELNEFISRPEAVNITDAAPDRVKETLSRIKTEIMERVRILVRERFFSPTNLIQWIRLYKDGGLGVDVRRRAGILAVEEYIAPNETAFLLQTARLHMIDALEDIFTESIKQVEDKLHTPPFLKNMLFTRSRDEGERPIGTVYNGNDSV
jgi:hypothetical protein